MNARAGAALFLVAAAIASRADAQPGVDACIDDHVRAQEGRMNRRLLDARAALIRCSACPSSLASECTTWLEEVNRAVPSVVIAVRDHGGRDVQGGVIRLDGRAVAAPGIAVELDPGEHEVVVTVGAEEKRERFVATEGEKGRTVVLTFGKPAVVPPPLAPVAEPSRPIPASAWVSGSVGLAALTGFGIFLGLGESVRADLEDAGCKPRCPRADIDRGNTYYVVGDVFLGAFGVAAVTTFILVLTRPEVPAPGSRAQVDAAPWVIRF